MARLVVSSTIAALLLLLLLTLLAVATLIVPLLSTWIGGEIDCVRGICVSRSMYGSTSLREPKPPIRTSCSILSTETGACCSSHGGLRGVGRLRRRSHRLLGMGLLPLLLLRLTITLTVSLLDRKAMRK